MSNLIKKFEELECWKESRKLVRMIYQSTSKLPFSKDFGLRDQIQRASISVMANIAEGFETYSDQEFIRFLGFSLRSSSEVKSHLYAALDIGHLTPLDFEEMYKQTASCSNLIKAFIKYLRAS